MATVVQQTASTKRSSVSSGVHVSQCESTVQLRASVVPYVYLVIFIHISIRS